MFVYCNCIFVKSVLALRYFVYLLYKGASVQTLLTILCKCNCYFINWVNGLGIGMFAN